MKIHSSKYHSIIYNVSFHHCDCKDFENRLLPCKHMYKLALELGVIDENWNISGLSEEIKNRIESLDSDTKSAFLNIINTNQAYSSFKYIKKRMPDELFKCGLLEILFDDYTIINSKYTKNDIISSLVLSKSDFDITPQTTKASMILWIMNNDKKLANKLARKHREVCYSFDVSSEYESIRRYYRDYMISPEL